jgi:hypothetical protein
MKKRDQVLDKQESIDRDTSKKTGGIMRRVLLPAVMASIIPSSLSFQGPAIAAKFGSVIIPVYFIKDVANKLKLFKNDVIS